jgi:hypothetical protein
MTARSDRQLWNATGSIISTVFGIVIVEIGVLMKHASSNRVIDPGDLNVTPPSMRQFAKAPFPKSLTLFGTATFSSLVLKKFPLPMRWSNDFLSNVIDYSLLHSAKQFSPSVTTDLGMNIEEI